ncbi:acyl-CoA dehydrogenase family protein [Natrinema gelatinilyticum]|uniref:acyl-CoA dehydrogenase family protein n=1 Tax=Natrinema gelatinilyticum TaxID=2961571 RepID=UPI0020C4597E|nr:acyl-CoA dehydrogenase family protein [Natrinema gelatinilyticum]
MASQTSGQFMLNDEQQAIRAAVREFGEAEIEPVASEYDESHEYPWDVVEKAAAADLVGPFIPAKYGGAGMDVLETAIVTEELWRADPGIGAAIDLMAFNSTLYVMNNYATEEQKEEWFSGIAAGQKSIAIGISEAAHGSDVASIETRAERNGDEYVVNGEKMWISNGSIANAVLLVCKTDPGARYDGISTILVPLDADGVTTSKIDNKLGLHASDTAEIVFDDVRVPAENLVGEENRGWQYFNEAMAPARVQVAAQALGAAQGALDAAIDYAQEREQFGQKIGEFQAIRHKIAEMATNVEAARSLTYRAAGLYDAGEIELSERFASIAKLFASDRGFEVADEAVQVFGGAGYVTDHPVERYLRDVRVTKIYEGTNEIQKEIIGNRLLGL